jgi:hypothetical protein
MGGMVSTIDTTAAAGAGVGWSWGARVAVSAAIAVHAVAALAAALAGAPSSPLERAVADRFAAYYQVLDQGYAYRYYAPEPGPTPVVTATVRFDDGRPERTVRLPERGVWPRLRYQRQLALAYHLVADFEEVRRNGVDGASSLYARSYARTQPGCSTVTLYKRIHLIPNPEEVRAALAEGNRVDIDAEEHYTAPERIGEFPCDGS